MLLVLVVLVFFFKNSTPFFFFVMHFVVPRRKEPVPSFLGGQFKELFSVSLHHMELTIN